MSYLTVSCRRPPEHDTSDVGAYQLSGTGRWLRFQHVGTVFRQRLLDIGTVYDHGMLRRGLTRDGGALFRVSTFELDGAYSPDMLHVELLHVLTHS